MNRTIQALAGLRSESERLRTDPVRFRIDPDRALAALLGTLTRMREESMQIRVQHPPLNPRTVWTLWEANGFDISVLDSRQIRTLCTSEETALEPQLIDTLAARPELLKRSICLFGIVVAYFSHWRTMKTPGKVESLILAALSRHKSPGSIAEMWNKDPLLFSPGAADQLAAAVVNSMAQIGEVLEKKLIPLTSALSLQVRARTADLAAQAFCDQEATLSEAQTTVFLAWMIGVAWSFPVPKDAFYQSVNRMILSKAAERHPAFRQRLMEYIRSDNRLGDPRLSPNKPKWRDVSADAGQRFLSWLARDSILFFFNTILPDDSNNRRRKDFWLMYHRASIRDFQVAVSDQDLNTLKRHFLNKELPVFSRVNHPTTSAFLMRFSGGGRDYIIVEFSETGHAAYVHDAKSFENAAGSLRAYQFDLRKHLMNDLKVERIVHRGSWEEKARYMLSALGIRP